MAENNSLGKILTKESADREFGPSTYSVLISSDQLRSIASLTTNLLMFNIINEKLIILGDERKPLYPEGYVVPADVIFRVYSKEKVFELLDTGSESNNFVEIRGGIITVTNGDYTLEFGSLCPPWCSS